MRHALLSTACVLALVAAACSGSDPVYERCITERKTYCTRMFACVKLGTLVGVTVSYQDESHCETEETKECDQVSSTNPCPGENASAYSSSEHEQCVRDQQSQECGAFANRPSSCSSYCSATRQGS